MGVRAVTSNGLCDVQFARFYFYWGKLICGCIVQVEEISVLLELKYISD